jgi:hypothetical protein
MGDEGQLAEHDFSPTRHLILRKPSRVTGSEAFELIL